MTVIFGKGNKVNKAKGSADTSTPQPVVKTTAKKRSGKKEK